MYKLFLAPNSYAMTVHAILEDIGVDYELKWVSIFTDTPDAEFVSVSPHARVPALQHEDGALCETGAVAWFLSERHPHAGLQLDSDDTRRGMFLQWFHYLATTLQPDVMVQFHPEAYFSDAADQQRFKQASMQRLSKVLHTLEEALSDGPFFMGTQRTLLDYLLAMQALWPEIYPTTIADYPNIHRLVETMVSRPAVARVIKAHEAQRGESICPSLG